MILPFFIQKLWDITPKIKFTYINHDKVDPRQSWDNFKREWQRNNPQPRAGYIKHHRSQEWHPFNGTFLNTPLALTRSSNYHEDVCARMYQVETLDGSGYYLCQHGQRVK